MSTGPELPDDLKVVGQITDQQIASLRSALSLTERIYRPEGLAAIASEVVSLQVAESLVRQLFQLHNTVRRSGLSACELIEIRRAEFPNDEMAQTGLSNLERLADVESIARTSKAVELAYDSDNLLQRTRILTDVRPLFSEDAQAVVGAVVAHTLRLRYDSAGIDHEISLALDSSDIHKLIEDCQRALTKEKTAQEHLCNRAEVPSFGMKDT